VHVDFQTQQRTPKASAEFYARVIASHGAALAESAQSAQAVQATNGSSPHF